MLLIFEEPTFPIHFYLLLFITVEDQPTDIVEQLRRISGLSTHSPVSGAPIAKSGSQLS